MRGRGKTPQWQRVVIYKKKLLFLIAGYKINQGLGFFKKRVWGKHQINKKYYVCILYFGNGI